MDILKKELAPLSADVWQEIENRTAEVLKSRLSARKAVHVDGPRGWEFTSISEGRLDLAGENGDVRTGVYRVSPLTEARVSFTLNRWELDNLGRGARDIDLGPLEAAAAKIADFEEQAIYSGYSAGGIVGLQKAASNKAVPFGKDGGAIMEAIAKAMLVLQKQSVDGPFSLIVGEEAYLRLSKEVGGLPLMERIERLTGAKVIPSLSLTGALLIPYDNENLELTVGQDFAVGYENSSSKDVTLFITESFIFRVIDPTLIVPFTL